MKAKQFNPEQSLKTITEAIDQAKNQKTDAYYYYILWGGILCIHFGLLYLNTSYPNIKGSITTNLIWAVLVIGGLLSYWHSKRKKEEEKVKLFTEKVYLFAFGGYALGYGVIFMSSMIFHSFFFLTAYSLLLGIAVFMSGGINKDKVSIVGGILAIIFAGISISPSLELKYLMAALASLSACFVPGIIMKIKHA